ncbi:hypothetical protein BsWGS_22563 [Bradybaena similaris]
MIIHVWKGDLKIPAKVFYLFSCVTCLALVLCIHLLRHDKSEQDTFCTDDYLNEALSELKKPPGCTADPPVTNTWASCPKCFRPTVENISKKFIEVPRSGRLFPRGPPNFFKLRETVQQDLVRNVLISPTAVCVKTCPYLLALQLSVSDHYDERNAIRETWGSVAKTKIWPHASMNADFEILFVLAHKNQTGEGRVREANTNSEMRLIQAEANRHGDILYLDMMDSYNNLTLKLISTLHWVRWKCPRTKFFLKVDADTFVNVPLLVDLLIYNENLLEFSITGHMYAGDKYAYRDGRWGVSKELYPLATFPVYASGCAYVISASALFTMVRAAPYIPTIPIEDAFITGILAHVGHIRVFDGSQGVFTHFKDFYWQRCQMVRQTKLVGTLADRSRVVDIWAAILERNDTCFWEDYSYVFEKYYKLIVVG